MKLMRRKKLLRRKMFLGAKAKRAELKWMAGQWNLRFGNAK